MISAIGGAGQLPPVGYGAEAGPVPGAPASPPPAGSPPVPSAPELQPTVSQALEAQQAAADKAAEQAAKVQAAMIDKVTSQGGAEELTIRPSRVSFQRDLETGRVAVEVFDALTGEKTGQMPSEQLMRTMSNISKQIGLLLDKTG